MEPSLRLLPGHAARPVESKHGASPGPLARAHHTWGHSGDAGTKTRVEAFLHCVREDLRSGEERRGGEESPACQNLDQVTRQPHSLSNIRKRGEMVLIPRMGPGAEALASCLRGGGVAAEALPLPDREALHLGRRYTSGKECSPMWITLGSLLQRVQRERDPLQRFTFFMPTANGPCRFGVYNILHRMVLARLGHAEKVSIWSPPDDDYFEGLPAGFAALVQIGFSAADWLQEALYYCRPIERRPGEVEAIYERFSGKLYCRLEAAASGDLSLPNAMLQVANGRLFGCTALLREAAAAFRAASIDRPMPTALVVGEIYVRCDPFANDFIIERLEARGIRARFAPFSEWLEYTDHLSRSRGPVGFSAQLSSLVQRRIQNLCYAAVGDTLAWPKRTTVKESIHAARPYVREDLEGEALLTLGGPVHEWREGLIDGVVSVGPHECMPNKVAEAQFFHVAEQEGLLSVTIPVNGDPTDPEIVDSFAFELRSRFEARQSAATTRRSRKPKRALAPR